MYSGFVPEPECGHGLAAGNRHSTLTTASIFMTLRPDPSQGSGFLFQFGLVDNPAPESTLAVAKSPFHSLTSAPGGFEFPWAGGPPIEMKARS